MKKVLVILALLAMTGIASADLLSNGDFSLGYEKPAPEDPGNTLGAVDWVQWTSGGWNNRETNAVGTYGDPDNYHIAIGNAGGYGAGAYQDLAATAGTTFQLTADAALDTWWLNSGYLKFEFYDAAYVLVGEVESPHFSQPDYDQGLAWANYSLIGTAPAGTEIVRAALGTYGEGGTARFDNAVLTVVPEPATLALLGLGALVLRRKK